MKKSLTFVLAAVIALAAFLSGCGNDRVVIHEGPAPAETTAMPTTVPETTAAPTEATIPSVQSWSPSEDLFSDYFETGIEGKTEFNVYSNSYFGFKFTPADGSDWVVLDQEMLVEYNKLNNALMSEAYADNAIIQETIKEGKNVTVLAAASLSQTEININGIVSPRPAGISELSLKFVLQMLVGEMEKQIQSIGLTDATVTVEDVLFMGKLTPCMSVKSQGKHQKQVTVLGEEYWCNITVTATDEASCDYYLSWFEAYP